MSDSISFAHTLLSWYARHKRELPWRGIRDPYRIWLSEVILQQTRIAQGKDYYLRFLWEFPDVESLAAAPEDKVMKLWEGLGYYSRARNLHYAARQIAERGHFPDTPEEVKALKGVGDYTAAAICSMAYGTPIAALDGNAYRVFGRIFSVETPIDTTAGKKYYNELANSLLDKQHAGEFNQAIMDFGAMQCLPKNPACAVCPFADKCGAHTVHREEHFPVRSKRIQTKDRYLNYFFILHDGKTLIRKRQDSDIWKGMYEPYLVETPDRQEIYDIHDRTLQQILSTQPLVRVVRKDMKHVLTHRRLWLNFYTIYTDAAPSIPADQYRAIPLNHLQELAFPAPIKRIIEKIV